MEKAEGEEVLENRERLKTKEGKGKKKTAGSNTKKDTTSRKSRWHRPSVLVKDGGFFSKVKRQTFLKAALQIRKRILFILQQSLTGNVSEFDVARVR